jgi:hypothetical protein
MEARLSPGDVIFFPPGWCHHTESLGDSVSSTCRLAGWGGGGGGGGGEEGAPLAGGE